ncbi:SdiA-regulated domain-containing protein [Hymenobacter sp. YC55]|uniref:SdiA-regulated domain-containing protein n=1 Tax=Hymenobacter sp. YC55 TaxID=3034019 RepID=UPI0023F85806|nr:SdiA-regulated domain-containing protein [Hymenobacter sp. YC55]MDF7811473.1 SdiA-regulated domain-containing protein [Hymenobacter sp. YC55]
MKNLLFSLLLFTNWCSTPTTHVASLATVPVVPARTVGQLRSAPASALARMGYDFSSPTATYSMPSELAELSGIALSGATHITGVEDETGNLYQYNLAEKQVEQVVSFGQNGDYEDLARVGNDWFILRSDGTLFRYTTTGTQEYKTGLTFANEPEGLAYDAASKTLLVACKGEPGADLPDTKRAIYRLQAGTFQAEAVPAYVLDVPAIVAAEPGQSEPAKKSGKKGKKKDERKGFAPSAVAVHPLTHHVFVLSAHQNGLVELDEAGKLVAVQSLPAALFPQPEGLAFAANGDLYIATEAGKKSGQATIYLFRSQS